MALIHNGRTKLTATFLNGVAITVFAAGALAPAVAVAARMNGPDYRLLLIGPMGAILLAAAVVFFPPDS